MAWWAYGSGCQQPTSDWDEYSSDVQLVTQKHCSCDTEIYWLYLHRLECCIIAVLLSGFFPSGADDCKWTHCSCFKFGSERTILRNVYASDHKSKGDHFVIWQFWYSQMFHFSRLRWLSARRYIWNIFLFCFYLFICILFDVFLFIYIYLYLCSFKNIYFYLSALYFFVRIKWKIWTACLVCKWYKYKLAFWGPFLVIMSSEKYFKIVNPLCMQFK